MIVSGIVTAGLISGAIAGGSQIASSAMQSRASNKAADTSAAAADEAINWEKQQHAEEQARLAPYREMGGQAYTRMGERLGLAPSPTMTKPAESFSMARTARPRAAAPGAGPGAGSFSMTRSPAAGGAPQIGQRKTFPNGRVGEWDGRGWKAVA